MLIFLKSYSNSNWVFFRGLFKGTSKHEFIKDSTLEFSVLKEGFCDDSFFYIQT